MPVYAYACKKCHHRFEQHQSFTDAALTECPECGGPLRKEYGSIGVTFSGSGFYRTDSRAAAGTGDSGASSGDSGSGSASSSSEAKASPAPAGL